jgi:hypothetical protein
MNKFLIIFLALLLTGCSKPEMVRETVYVDKVNQCKQLPMPDTFVVSDWGFEKKSIDIYGVKYIVYDIREYETLIRFSQNHMAYTKKLKKLLKICRE